MTTVATSRVDELLARVREIASTIREHAAEAEQARCLSRPVVDAMLKARDPGARGASCER